MKKLVLAILLFVLLPVLPAQAECNGYVVQAGDNLFRIALNHNETLAQLKSDNGLPDNLILPGQCLKVPGAVSGPTQMPNSVDSILFNGHTFVLVDTNDPQNFPSHNPGIVYHVTIGNGLTNLVYGAHSDSAGVYFNDLQIGDLITVNVRGAARRFEVIGKNYARLRFMFVSASFFNKPYLVLVTCWYDDDGKLIGRLLIHADELP